MQSIVKGKTDLIWPRVLGEIEYAEFVAVTIRETDAQSAAIEGALLTQDQVIISSNKPVGEGDRVRSET